MNLRFHMTLFVIDPSVFTRHSWKLKMKRSLKAPRHQLESAQKKPQLQQQSDASFDNMNVGEKVRRFNVVYGKASSRKHTAYTDEGTLEICGKKAVLKDEYGKVRIFNGKIWESFYSWTPLYSSSDRLNLKMMCKKDPSYGLEDNKFKSLNCWKMIRQ